MKQVAILFFLIYTSIGFSQEKKIAVDIAAPKNVPVKIIFDKKAGRLQLIYEGKSIVSAQVNATEGGILLNQQVDTINNGPALSQTIKLSGANLHFSGLVSASNEAIAAENNSSFQNTFSVVRTTIGNASANLRNNAVYDRYSDWMIEIKSTGGTVRITPQVQAPNTRTFNMMATGGEIEIVFRPLFYQKHKGIKYFTPRNYKVWKEPVTGWSSWYAYFRKFNEQNVDDLMRVWKEKQMADFGYKYIQIDDAYQGEEDKGHNAPLKGPNDYYATGPKTWLSWKKDLFPGGLKGYVKTVNNAGFTPGVWMGCFFTATDTVQKHPNWFVQDSLGQASIGGWVTYAIDATNKEAASTLIRPTFRGWKTAGMKYVKIDQLRHYLYDNMNNNLQYFRRRGITPDDVFRSYLKIAREELGRETFMLSCWGVLPQAVGIVDACRMGGDGYGPVTMQQYNSWNGIVWINDPDHCDIYPDYKPAEAGNVKSVAEVKAALSGTRLRPALASVAGCMLLLSDKPEVYENDQNMEGVKRSSPVLFSVPGQLYDYDPVKSSLLPQINLQDIKTGAGNSPIDADQYGAVCPWWLNEINRNFENWNVLSRMNWTKNSMPQTSVKFADLGLNSNKAYLVFEFWNKQFLGIYKDSFQVQDLAPSEIHTFSIREKKDHPQIVSTNRHLSQGGYDLINVEWKQNSLSGKSKVVKNDKYELYVYVPEGYNIKTATVGTEKMKVLNDRLSIISFTPSQTGEINWKIVFDKK